MYGSNSPAAQQEIMAVQVQPKLNEDNTGSNKMVSCILQPLLTQLIRQLLQHMTDSIVNWINSGFNGNPAFLTNPDGFFADIADQATGAFLAQSGPLQALCSPFGLDIRLNLALNQSNTLRQRYTCTLSTIITNLQKGPKVSVGVGSSANGATIGSIQNGSILGNSSALSVNGWSINGFGNDFSQGGWPAFIAMSTEPQNNIYGAWLMAQSDQRDAIEAKQKAANNDLNRGNGFLSWQKCTTIDGVGEQAQYSQLGVSSSQYQRLQSNGYVSTGANAGIKSVTTSDGSVSYQRCTTETPGSFISGSLMKQTGSSVDSIVNIPNIDEAISNSINTVAQALLSQALQHGLADLSNVTGSSGGGTSGTQSIIDQLTAQEDSNTLSGTKNITIEGLDASIATVKSYISTREQAVTVIKNTVATYNTASACFRTKNEDSSAAAVANEVTSKVNPAIALYQGKFDSSSASTSIRDLLTIEGKIVNATSTAEVNTLSQAFTAIAQTIAVSTADVAQANSDLTDAQNLAAGFQAEAANFENICTSGGIATSTDPVAATSTQAHTPTIPLYLQHISRQ